MSRPVDTARPAAHCADVDKKPHKVEEPQAAYTPKQSAKAVPALKKGPTTAEFDRIASKLLRERKELLHKLAQ